MNEKPHDHRQTLADDLDRKQVKAFRRVHSLRERLPLPPKPASPKKSKR